MQKLPQKVQLLFGPWMALFANLVIYIVLGELYLILPGQGPFISHLFWLNILFSLALIVKYRAILKTWWRSNFIRWRAEHLYRLAIICLIVALANFVVNQHNFKIDLSGIGRFQLSPETLQVLKRFKGPIEFTVYGDYELWEPLIKRYAYPKGTTIIPNRVDPALRPDLVKVHNITKANTLLIQYNGKTELVEKGDTDDELNVTNALIKLSRTSEPRVAYTVGHGELDLSKSTPEGGKHLADLLRQASFAPEALRLDQTNELSRGINTILILGPSQDFLPGEIKLLDKYIKEGGNLIIALNPRLKKIDITPNLRQWLRQWEIGLNNTLVIDRIRAVEGSQGMIPLGSELAVHPITQGLNGQVFFPITSAVEDLATPQDDKVKQDAENASDEEDEDNIDDQENSSGAAANGDAKVKFVALANTLPFPAAWADRRPWEMLKGGRLKYDVGEDIAGPITMAAAVTFGKSRLAVFGTSGLWQNMYQAYLSNYGLLLNAVAWQTEDDLLGGFNLAVGENKPLFLSEVQVKTLFYMAAIVLPLLMLAAALGLYLYRRKL